MGALTRHERRSCVYRASIPDALAGRELLLPAHLVAHLAEQECTEALDESTLST